MESRLYNHRGVCLPSEHVESKIFVLINKTIDLLENTKKEETRLTLLGILKRTTATLEKFLQRKHSSEQQEKCQLQIVVRVPGERWGM